MKLKDLLTTETWEEYGDLDVINDVTDDYFCAWCGNTFTEEGYTHYKNVLELEAEIDGYDEYSRVILVHVDDVEGLWQYKFRMARDLFSDMCGYCTEEEYNEWFID